MIPETWLRVKALLRRGQLDRDLEDELQFHLAMRERSSSETSARRHFGNVALFKESCRDLWTFAWLEAILQDLRYGVRILRRSPVFTAVAVLSLALGIGANTAIFSVIDVLLLKALPVKDPAKLFFLGTAPSPGAEHSFTYPAYRRLRDESQTVVELAAYSPVLLSVTIDGQTEPLLGGQLVSGNYYSVLGVNAVTGRTIVVQDDIVPRGHPVAVISYSYWNRRFGLAPSVIGRSIRIDGIPFVILGVTPPGFCGAEVGSCPDISVPLMMQPDVMPETESWLVEISRVSFWLRVVGRLKPSVSEHRALGIMSVAHRQVAADYAAKSFGGTTAAPFWQQQKLVLKPGSRGFSNLRQQFSEPLLILMTLVGMVLMIACANVANLLLARARARQSEIAVRLAIGAGRQRLVRQLLAENMLLWVLGGAGGFLLAYWMSKLLVALMSAGRSPILLDLHPDFHVLGFTAMLSLVTALGFGIGPALRATKIDLSLAMKGSSHGRFGRNPRLSIGRPLAVIQIVLSLSLLIGAGLFVQSFRRLNRQDLGFARNEVLVVRVEPRGSDQKWANRTRLANTYSDLLQRVEAIPGVRTASLAGGSPLGHNGFGGWVSVTGYPQEPGEDMFVRMTQLYPNYFATVGMPLLLGRDFTARDMSEQASKVAVINETMARRFFFDENPLGREFKDGSTPFQIVGVVKDAKYSSLRVSTPSMAYMPFLQTFTGHGQMTLHVRLMTSGQSTLKGIMAAVRREVHAVDADIPMFDIETLAEQIDAATAQEYLLAVFSGSFSVLALFLASIGLYGVIAYSVELRTSEIGIRLAVGATRPEVLVMVLKESLLLVGVGIAIGVPVALAATRLVASKLFGVSAADPLTIVVAVSLMITLAALAGFLPAQRASRVHPMVALRHE